jgi:hypothetical protein
MNKRHQAQIAFTVFSRCGNTDYSQSNAIHEKWLSDCKPDGQTLTYCIECYVFRDGSVFAAETYDGGWWDVAPSVERFIEETKHAQHPAVAQMLDWLSHLPPNVPDRLRKSA